MTPQAITDKLKARFSEAILEVKIEGVIDPYMKLAPSKLAEVSLFLRDDPELQFDFLMCLSGTDNGKGLLGVVYNLHSITQRHKITLKVEVPADKAELPSVSQSGRRRTGTSERPST